MATRSGWAAVNGANLYYEVAGGGHPLLMVHAGIADRRMWDAQFDFFAQRYQVVRYDLRGFGQTPPVAADHQRCEDLRALLDFLHIDRAYLMGCSMGGSACMDFALQYPARAAALILVGSSPNGFAYPEWSPTPLVAALEAAFAQGDYALVNELSLQVFVDGTGRPPDQVDPALRQKVAEMNLIGLQNIPASGKDVPLTPPAAERLAELRLPMLIVTGDRDEEYIARAAAFMQQQIAHARAIVLPGTAHLPNMEFPQAFNAQVQAFLDGLPV